MINEDFYILHLSDLHIRNEQGSGTSLLSGPSYKD